MSEEERRKRWSINFLSFSLIIFKLNDLLIRLTSHTQFLTIISYDKRMEMESERKRGWRSAAARGKSEWRSKKKKIFSMILSFSQFCLCLLQRPWQSSRGSFRIVHRLLLLRMCTYMLKQDKNAKTDFVKKSSWHHDDFHSWVICLKVITIYLLCSHSAAAADIYHTNIFILLIAAAAASYVIIRQNCSKNLNFKMSKNDGSSEQTSERVSER